MSRYAEDLLKKTPTNIVRVSKSSTLKFGLSKLLALTYPM